MNPLLRLALLAYPQPLRARYGEELAEFPVTPFSLLDVVFAGLRERFDNGIRDVRHASRALLRTPGASAVAILALALGVGANVAVFSVVRPVLLEPLPFADADRLYTLRAMVPARPGRPTKFDAVAFDYHYLNWRDESKRFETIEAWRGRSQTLLRDDRSEFVSVGSITSGFFHMLGLEALTGRAFGVDDYRLDAPNVAVVSERFWRNRLGGDAQAAGDILVLDEQPYEIVGVAPDAAARFMEADVWIPLRLDEAQVRGGGPNWSLGIVGRLAEGFEIDSAKEELDAILTSHDADDYQRAKKATTLPQRVDHYLLGDVRLTLHLLWGAVALVLLIACLNVAGVLLVRALARHGETGVRLALGAGRRTLFGQAVTESVLLSLVGGGAGVFLAYGGVRVLKQYLPSGFPRTDEIGVDVHVLGFALGIAVLVGLLLGLAPAWAALRHSPSDTIRMRGSTSTAGRAMSGVQGGLVASQVAFAAILLTAAGLFLYSLVKLGRVDIGVDSPETASVWVTLPGSYPEASRPAYFREALERAAALPGAKSAALSSTIPLMGFIRGQTFELPGEPALPANSDELRERNIGRLTMINAVSDDYFRTVGARLLQGRSLEQRDAPARNAVVNRTLADRAFPGEDALGKSIGLGSLGFFTIVGVVQDYRQMTPRWPIESEIFLHWEAEGMEQPRAISVRPTGAGKPMMPALRDVATDLHTAALVRDEWTQGDLLASKSADDRFRTALLGLFAVLAVALAGSGIFASVSFTVSRRTREIAIRRALGATAASVCATALRGALIACAAGAATGLTVAYWLRSLTDGMLFEVDPLNPTTYVAAAFVLLALALGASLGPASRAARLDPVQNLRAD